MGLDNYWVKPDSYKTFKLSEAEGLNICGGMVSEHGCGSFRGKVYNQYVEEITGVSLYQDRIYNYAVQQMAEALEGADCPADFIEQEDYDGQEEWNDLVKMFCLYADAGADLVAFY